jgi:hypothetical protein
MQGLLELLQGGGQTVSGGWLIIIDLLTSVPASMVPQETLKNPEMSPISNWHSLSSNDQQQPLSPNTSPSPSRGATERGRSSGGEYSDDLLMPPLAAADASKVWPDAALQIAFFCLKLIVDDFLESLPLDVIKNVITCLSMFSAQLSDVNISLTSVEMLWKVTDFIMTSSRNMGDDVTTTAVLDVMLRRLLFLALDQRPEIRNCATNTLFSAIVTNAPLLSTTQWKRAFDDVIFPLFSRVEARSGLAIKSNEEAKAPEIKRGVKMTLHHSRDNAHKQWSETRVLALRGLSRVMRACVKHLLTEAWFSSHCWVQALEICVFAVQAGDFDLEVCLAGVDSIFDLIKSVSARLYKTKVRATAGMRVVGGALVEEPAPTSSASALRAREAAHAAGDSDQAAAVSALAVSEGKQEVCRQALWEVAWSAVRMAICYGSVGTELPIHICKHLQELYVGGIESEFRYSQNVKSLLEMLVILARPRVAASVIQRTTTGPVTGTGGASATQQQFSILQFETERPQSEGNSSSSMLRSSARMGKLGTSQLHRAIMTLLRSIRPHDVLSFSCLVVAISDLCFTGAHYAQMASTNLTSGLASVSGTGAVAGTGGEEEDAEAERRIIFSPVDEALRSEACKYLMLLFSPDSGSASDQSFSDPSSGVGFAVSSDWLATGVEVVVRKFVEGLCEPLLATRASNCHITRPPLTSTSTASISSAGAVAVPQKASSASTQESRGFLSSLARILTLEEDNSDEEHTVVTASEERKTGDPGVATAASLCLIPLHAALDSTSAPAGASGVSVDSPSELWKMFPLSLVLMEALAIVLDSGLPALQTLSLKSDSSAKKSILVLRQLLSVVACLISPWHPSLDLFVSPPHLPLASPSATKTQTLLPSPLDILMISALSSHPHATADHRQDLQAGQHQRMAEVIRSAIVFNTRIVHTIWSHFLIASSSSSSSSSSNGVLEPLVQVFVTSSRLIVRALSIFSVSSATSMSSSPQLRRAVAGTALGAEGDGAVDVILAGDPLVFHLSMLQIVRDLFLSLFHKPMPFPSPPPDSLRIKSRYALSFSSHSHFNCPSLSQSAVGIAADHL